MEGKMGKTNASIEVKIRWKGDKNGSKNEFVGFSEPEVSINGEVQKETDYHLAKIVIYMASFIMSVVHGQYFIKDGQVISSPVSLKANLDLGKDPALVLIRNKEKLRHPHLEFFGSDRIEEIGAYLKSLVS